MTLKIEVDEPMPRARVMIATAAKPGPFRKFLSAYRTSCPHVPISAPRPGHSRHQGHLLETTTNAADKFDARGKQMLTEGGEVAAEDKEWTRNTRRDEPEGAKE